LAKLRKQMPMPLLGFDTDNDSVFMNETVRDYCQAEGVAFYALPSVSQERSSLGGAKEWRCGASHRWLSTLRRP
jgi:hypothetical protein